MPDIFGRTTKKEIINELRDNNTQLVNKFDNLEKVNTDLETSHAELEKKILNISRFQPRQTDLIKRIVKTQLFRTKQDLLKWKRSLDRVEDVHNPDWTDYIRVLQDVMLDGHLNGILSAIKNKVKAKEFHLVDKDGDVDDEATKLFQKEWFFKYLDWNVEAPFYGMSVIQLGDIIDDGFPNIELVPRQYVINQRKFIKKDLYVIITDVQNGWFYDEPPLKPWFIGVGDVHDLGLLNICAPHALGKKNLLAAAWEHADIFGMPLRIGKTDLAEPVRRRNMENMMNQMGSAASAVIDKEGDEVEFVENTKADAYKVYLEPFNTSNKEMSKTIISSTGAFEEKAFVGSSEVQERMFEVVIQAYLRKVMFNVNGELIPRMQHHRISIGERFFKWDTKENLTLTQKTDIIQKLSTDYNFDERQLNDFMDLPEMTAKQNPLESVKEKIDKINNFYKNKID